MNTDRESEIREQMTRHWLASENAIRAYIAGAVNSFTDREDLLQQVALTMARRFEEFDEGRPFLAWALKGPATSLHQKNTGDFSRSHDHRKAIPKLTSIGSTYCAPRLNLRAPLRVQETASIGQRPIESRQEKVESGKIRDLEIV
jgi:hypothetical protein